MGLLARTEEGLLNWERTDRRESLHSVESLYVQVNGVRVQLRQPWRSTDVGETDIDLEVYQGHDLVSRLCSNDVEGDMLAAMQTLFRLARRHAGKADEVLDRLNRLLTEQPGPAF